MQQNIRNISPLEIEEIPMETFRNKLYCYMYKTNCNNRFLTYRTSDGKDLIIIDEKLSTDHGWIPTNYIMLPVEILPTMFNPTHTSATHSTRSDDVSTRANPIVKEVPDVQPLTLHERKLFFNFECTRVPCSPNQLQLWDEIEMLENKWHIVEIESPTTTTSSSSTTTSSSSNGYHSSNDRNTNRNAYLGRAQLPDVSTTTTTSFFPTTTARSAALQISSSSSSTVSSSAATISSTTGW